jgi:hypothetical protein
MILFWALKPKSGEVSISDKADQITVLEKHPYIKQVLGRWFDIYQPANKEQSRPIKNLKVDLYPMALYELLQYAPKELVGEDL